MAVITSIAVHVHKRKSFSFISIMGESGFLVFFQKMTCLFFRTPNQTLLKTIVIVALAVVFSIGLVVAVIVVGEMYQQELFEEYMDDAKDSQSPRPLTNPNLPPFDILP